MYFINNILFNNSCIYIFINVNTLVFLKALYNEYKFVSIRLYMSSYKAETLIPP